ncbi:MAG: hypothetical protein GY851_35210 [bacterium]|nr:hypothetical protein [bacterium]
MRCERVREKFVDYLEGEARLTERLCVDVHVARCYTCREELEDTRQFLLSCRQALRHPNPRYRFSALMADVKTGEANVRYLPRRRALHLRENLARLTVAAVVLVVIGVSSPLIIRGGGMLVGGTADAGSAAEIRVGDEAATPDTLAGRRDSIEEEAGEPARLAEPVDAVVAAGMP